METQAAVDALHALAQPTRLEVFRLLVRRGYRGACAGEIAEALDVAPATLSFHLTALRRAGLVDRRSAGRERIYQARLTDMHALLDYLSENCCEGADCHPSELADATGERAR